MPKKVLLAALACAAVQVVLMSGLAMARPSVGRPGGGGGMARPAGGMARPAGGMARPAARPQMPQARPAAQKPALSRPNVQRPNVGGQRPNLNLQRPNLSAPNLQRPSLGGIQRPGAARPTLPNLGQNRPNLARPQTRPAVNAPRPGLGSLRPSGLPGVASRPAPRPGLSRPAGTSRPTTLPGQLGNRPGRPGLVDRPSTRPAFPKPGVSGRPGIGGVNRPNIGDGTIGSGNLGIGSGNLGSGNNNNAWFGDVNVNSPWGNLGGGWNGGNWNGGNWNGGNWAHNWNTGYVNPHYGGWYNGCWSGNWGYGGGWWAPFALGAATWGLASTVANWGLGYGCMGYGSGAYVNPYYAAMSPGIVAASPYDYSQPVVVNNYVTNDGDLTSATDAQGGVASADASAANPAADRAVDEALQKFKAGDYPASLAALDKAVKLAPKDSVLHEVRALALFALGRYPEAAATLNAVLATAPGMDWTTLSGLYDSVDTYTTQLRKLEETCRAKPDDAAAHFVLAYHYLVGGYADMATEALKVVVAKQPGDAVAKRLLEAITPPEEAPASPSGAPAKGTSGPADGPAPPETDLVGSWKATSGKDSVVLSITEDATFSWKAMPSGKPAVELTGEVATARDGLALKSEKAGVMAGKVTSKGADAFEFLLAGAPADATPLEFVRVK